MNRYDKIFLDVIRKNVNSRKYINSLSDAEEALTKDSRQLNLRELCRITSEQARILARHSENAESSGGALWLDSISYLSDEAAENLAKYKGYLYLIGLQTISDRSAKYFSQFTGSMIELDCAINVSSKYYRILSEHSSIKFV